MGSMSGSLLGTVESAAGSPIMEVGLQLALLGSVALFLGSLRLLHAQRRPSRFVLTLGLALFAAASTVLHLEKLEVIVVDYYPNWEADREQIFYDEDPGLVFSEDDLEVTLEPPAWWEALAWWGQRLCWLGGTALATAGFALDGRALLGAPQRGRSRKGKARRR